MIVAEGLTRKFGDLTAVEDLTFRIKRGEVFGLLGPNGAGKSTTVRMLCCLISKSSGNAIIGDLDTSDKDDAMKIRKSIGYVPDAVGFYESMSAVKNLEYFARLYRCPESQIHQNIERYLKMLDLWEWKEKDISTFSKGMKQKVSIVRSLIHEPEILIMDEPTANLDPSVSKTIRDIIQDLRKENRTILLNTHNLDEAQRVCTRVGVLKTRMLAVDTPQNLERRVSERRTIITLDRVDDRILSAVRALNPKSVEVDGNSLSVAMDQPEKERPRIVEAVISAGGSVQFVTESSASLEEVYLKLVSE